MPRTLQAEHRYFLNLRPVYALGRWMLENFPASICYPITASFAELTYRVGRADKAALSANLKHVWGTLHPGASAAEVEAAVEPIVHQVYLSRGVYFADLSILATRRSMRGMLHFEGHGPWAGLKERWKSGKGAIVLSGHLGNYRMGGVFMGLSGVPIRAVAYRNHAANALDERVAGRGGTTQMYISDDPAHVLQIVRALREGAVVAITADRVGDSPSVEVPFFGKPARFPIGPVRLARLAGVPIYPAFCTWTRARHYVARMLDPIEVGDGDRDEAERDALAAFVRAYEGEVATHLDQWFAYSPFWRTA